MCCGNIKTILFFLHRATVVLRVQGDETIRPSTLSASHNSVQVPRLKMTRVHIPFTFRLLETGNNSYEGKCIFLISH